MRKIRERQFTFEAFLLNGEEESNEIKETQVVEYTFINQGSTMVDINGILLMPSWCGLPPHTYTCKINRAENDVTVYKYEFKGFPPFFNAEIQGAVKEATKPTFLSAGLDKLANPLREINSLLVIMKIRANRRTSEPQ